MKKNEGKKDEMRKEYDFSDGVRGKHFKKLQNGHTTIVNNSDGSTMMTERRPIILAPDVQAYFPDTESVNNALRGLIALVPEKRA